MSNLAYQHQQQIPKRDNQSDIKVKKVKRRSLITPFEKCLIILFIAFVAVMAIRIVSAQAEIYVINKDIQDIQSSISEQQKMNGDLEMQVSDLQSYDRIWKKAKELGLKLDENNVKVVDSK